MPSNTSTSTPARRRRSWRVSAVYASRWPSASSAASAGAKAGSQTRERVVSGGGFPRRTSGGSKPSTGAGGGPDLRRISSEFTPVPRPALRRGIESGELDPWDDRSLAALHDRGFPRGRPCVPFTLDQLRPWINWTKTDDALSKRLRRLRDKGWLTYETPRKRPTSTRRSWPRSRPRLGPRSQAADGAESDSSPAPTCRVLVTLVLVPSTPESPQRSRFPGRARVASVRPLQRIRVRLRL